MADPWNIIGWGLIYAFVGLLGAAILAGFGAMMADIISFIGIKGFLTLAYVNWAIVVLWLKWLPAWPFYITTCLIIAGFAIRSNWKQAGAH